MHHTEEPGLFHAFAHGGVFLADAVEDGLGGGLGVGELLLIQDAADAYLVRGKGDHPKPFVIQSNDDSVATLGPFIQFDSGKMTEDGELLQFGMNLAQPFLVAGEVAAAAGVHEKSGAELLGFTILTACLDDHSLGVGAGFEDGAALQDLGAGFPGMREHEMIEGGALDLKGFRLPRVMAVPENKGKGLGGIADMELRAEFLDQAGLLELGQDAHFGENLAIVREEGFTDMETGKVFFFEDEDAFAGVRQIGGSGAAARATANHNCVIFTSCHKTIKKYFGTRDKLLRVLKGILTQRRQGAKSQWKPGTGFQQGIPWISANRKAPAGYSHA